MQRWLWSGLFWFVTACAGAQQLRVEPGVDERILYLNELEYFVDSTQSIQFDQIASPEFR